MSHYIIDRRPNGRGKSAPNRKKLLDRVKGAVKKTIKDAVRDGNIADVVRGGKRVRVPLKDLNEPQIVHGEGGITERTLPHNQKHKFRPGDKVDRPPKQGGQGGSGKGDASDSGEGEDTFEFELTREEFLEYFFEDLELPELAQKQLAIVEEKKPKRTGFTRSGNPSNLDLLRTMKSSVGRRAALRLPKKKKLRELESQLAALNAQDVTGLDDKELVALDNQKLDLQTQIEALKRKLKAVPFVDDVDLQYRNFTSVPVPATQAVMFCLMDVSGSMGQWEKDIAKRFYMLLYLFLYKHYEKVTIVFVQHHTSAKEVDEHTFFYGRESGGTIVSAGMELVNQIIDERFAANQWNVYVAQASDGDNWRDDNAKTMKLLDQILTKVQYFFYIDITQGRESDLWTLYSKDVSAPNFDMQRIGDVNEIYPVFRKLFEAR